MDRTLEICLSIRTGPCTNITDVGSGQGPVSLYERKEDCLSSGSQKRKQIHKFFANCNDEEAARFRALIELYPSCSEMIKDRVFNPGTPLPRRRRVNKIELAALGQIAGELGRLNQAIETFQGEGDDAAAKMLKAIARDLADMRTRFFQATGRPP